MLKEKHLRTTKHHPELHRSPRNMNSNFNRYSRSSSLTIARTHTAVKMFRSGNVMPSERNKVAALSLRSPNSSLTQNRRTLALWVRHSLHHLSSNCKRWRLSKATIALNCGDQGIRTRLGDGRQRALRLLRTGSSARSLMVWRSSWEILTQSIRWPNVKKTTTLVWTLFLSSWNSNTSGWP